MSLTVIFHSLEDIHIGFYASQKFCRFSDIARFRIVHNHSYDGTSKSRLEMLVKILPRSKRIIPNGDCWAIIDGVAQFRQGHVQLIHPVDECSLAIGTHFLQLKKIFT